MRYYRNVFESEKMTGAEYSIVCEFENGLSVGDEVRVNWTNCGTAWSGRGTVKRINAKSIIVTLSEPVGGPGYYSAGQSIYVPRFVLGNSMKLWSVNNRTEPVDGYSINSKVRAPPS